MQILDALLYMARIASVAFAPILDCDEVFNYYEPLHYMLYGIGFQTWEYVPQFGLRSWAFLQVLALPLYIFNSLTWNKQLVFYAIRMMIALQCGHSQVVH